MNAFAIVETDERQAAKELPCRKAVSPGGPALRPRNTLPWLLKIARTARTVIFGIPLAAGCWPAKADSPSPLTRPGLTVTVAKSKSKCVSRTLMVTGTIVPRRELLVRPDRDGLILNNILAEEGEVVASGQLLAQLRPPGDQQDNATIVIRAPIDGLILAAPHVVGQPTSARGEPLFRIAADQELELSASASATQLLQLSTGQPAKVKPIGVNELSGRLRQVGTTVDSSTQLGAVRISIDHNDALLRAGNFARATIDVGQSCGVTIPLSALLFGPDGSVVQTIHNNTVETRRVRIRMFAQSNVQISEGLAEGETIVLRAGAFLRDGDHVRSVTVSE